MYSEKHSVFVLYSMLLVVYQQYLESILVAEMLVGEEATF